MSDSCDFPAAHSMDTTWFAVDRDGHVAMFQSGESGAVPESVCGEEFYAAPDEIAEIADGSCTLDPKGFVAQWAEPHVPKERLPNRAGATVMMFLRDTAEGRAALDGAEGRALAAKDAIAFEWESLDEARHDAIHAAGLCLGCGPFWGERPDVPGLYVFEHTAENWISGPYARVSIPDAPLEAAELPEDYLPHAVRFDGRFAETAQLQPAEIWKCGSWQPGWLAMDGRTVRPFEGQEEEFEDAIENLEGQDVEVKPPLAGLPDAEVLAPAAPKRRPPPLARPDFPPPAGGSETDFSRVLDDEAPEPPTKKKPWWKLW